MSDRSLRITNATVVTMDPERRVFAPGDVVIRGDRIASVGPHDAMGPAVDETIDATGMVAMPGLVNAHTHHHNAFERGLATEARTVEEWFLHVRPYGTRLTGGDVAVASELVCLEMIESGTTCFADSSNVDHTAPVVERVGLRALLTSTSLDQGPVVEQAIARRAAGEKLATIVGETDHVVRENLRQVREWNGRGDGRINVGMSVHSPDSASPELHRRIADAARADGIRVLEHVAESKAAAAVARERYGCTPVEFLRSMGILNEWLLAAHCVQLTDADIDLLAAHGVGVAHNPISNLRHGEVARVVAMTRSGVAVGLGTDSSASNADLDMFKEIHVAGMVQRTVADAPSWLGPIDLLALATIGSARAIGLGGSIGSLEAGKLADVILVDMGETHLRPSTNAIAQLAASVRGTDVDTTIVGGRVLMRGRRLTTIDKPAVLEAAQRAFDRIASEVARVTPSAAVRIPQRRPPTPSAT